MWQSLGLELGADVVREGPRVRQGGARGLPRLLADVVVVVAHPLFAAAARRPGQPRPGAAPVREGHLMWAERHAAHHPVHAAALVLAAGLEVLAVLEHSPAELTGPALGIRWRGRLDVRISEDSSSSICYSLPRSGEPNVAESHLRPRWSHLRVDAGIDGVRVC